jgi:hypothetical protein
MTGGYYYKEGTDWDGRHSFDIFGADGIEMASIRYWMDEMGSDDIAELESKARLIVAALNAFTTVAPRQPAEIIGGEGEETLDMKE